MRRDGRCDRTAAGIRRACRAGGGAVALALLLAGTAVAQGPEAAGGRTPAEPSPPGPPDAARQPSAEGSTWIDDLHRRLEGGLTDLTEVLDGAFGEDRRLDLEHPGTYLRWRNELRVDDGGKWSPRTSARASLQLPALKRWGKRLQLVFSGESKGDPTIRRLEDPGDPGFSPSVRAQQANLELRNDFFRRNPRGKTDEAGAAVAATASHRSSSITAPAATRR